MWIFIGIIIFLFLFISIDLKTAIAFLVMCGLVGIIGWPGSKKMPSFRIKEFQSILAERRAAEEAQKAKQRADEMLSSSTLEDRLRPVFDPQDFEAQIAELFRSHGYRVIETPYQGDHGIDLKVYNKDEYSVVQCKRYSSSPVGEPAVRDFFGTMQHEGADMGYIVTTSRFTKSAIEWAKGKRIVLINRDMLQQMMSEMGDSQMNRGVI